MYTYTHKIQSTTYNLPPNPLPYTHIYTLSNTPDPGYVSSHVIKLNPFWHLRVLGPRPKEGPANTLVRKGGFV